MLVDKSIFSEGGCGLAGLKGFISTPKAPALQGDF
jgi:hypothetical protein